MKVRNLIPNDLFDEEKLHSILKDDSPENSDYYKAILQNLFFATLNTKQNDRKFRSEKRGHKGINTDFGNHNVFRYQDCFQDGELLKSLFGKIPFLNGGLFDCLDYKTKVKEDRKYIDGFTAIKSQQPHIPNSLFFAEPQKQDLSRFYDKSKKNKMYEVEGIINLLNRYNFTIDENEPDDIEVALDPELLGSIFENLLASYNPETATTARKATGSFYTPREIVNYMTTESLKLYLKTALKDDTQQTKLGNVSEIEENIDSLLQSNTSENPFDEFTTKKIINLINELRVVDPAVGSGAFPMAMLNKLVFILSKIDPKNIFWEQTHLDGTKNIPDPQSRRVAIASIKKKFKEKNADYGRKLYLIEKCIYGVDIQQIAVEIAKLRFFISLLVDENIDSNKPETNYGIEPLPNLDFKLMQGNSLISTFAGIDFNESEKEAETISLDLSDPVKELIKEFEELKNEYLNVSDKEEKDNLLEKIEKTILNIFEEKISQHIPQLKTIEEKYATLPNKQQREKAITEAKQKLTKILGFDIEEKKKDLIAYTEGRKPKDFFLWNLYFAEVFTEKGGFDIVIANPPYNKERDNKELFQPIRNSDYSKYCQSKMDFWFLFLHRSFDIGRMKSKICFITSRYWIQNEGASKLIKRIKNNISFVEVIDIGKLKVFDNVVGQHLIALYTKEVLSNRYLNYYQVTDDITSISQKHSLLKHKQLKIEDIFTKDGFITFDPSLIQFDDFFQLSDYFNVSQGVVQNPDKVSKKMGKRYNIPVGDGVFVIDEQQLNNLNLTNNERKFVGPFYDEHQINRYIVKSTNQFLFYLNRHNCKDINQFPKILNHLSKYKDIMLNRRETRNGTNKYFHLHWPRDKKYFENKKIVIPAMNKRITAAFQNELGYFGISSNVIISKNDDLNMLLLLLGILNSNLCQYYFLKNSKKRGIGMDIGVKKIRNFPIPKFSIIEQNPIINNVDQILTAKKANPNADTTELEREIDLMVYNLYGLTYDEVKIVEPDFALPEEEYNKIRL